MTSIRVGIGGWVYAPWRGTFYPPALPQNQELAFASRAVTAIEINGTFYRTPAAESFRRWAAETPDDFVFTLKAPRYATHRRALEESGPSIERFLQSGVTELGSKLGPILWQFPPTRRFDPDAMEAFLALLPRSQGQIPLRHVIETYHPSFATPAWFALLRQHGIAAAIVDSEKHTLLSGLTAPFAYVRLERNSADAHEGYDSAALDRWADRMSAWAAGRDADDPAAPVPDVQPGPRDCFVFFIGGDKHRAPDAARAMLRRLDARS